MRGLERDLKSIRGQLFHCDTSYLQISELQLSCEHEMCHIPKKENP